MQRGGGCDLMTYLNYLAYGSNLHLSRMQRWVPSARTLGAVELAGWRLRFHKRGRDGSGKCNVIETGAAGDSVHAVVYRIDAQEQPLLHRIEGLGDGYVLQRMQLSFYGEAFLYVAAPSHIYEDLQPFSWYKAYVLEGARFHGLPVSYIEALEAAEALPDPDPRRQQDHLRLLWHLSR